MFTKQNRKFTDTLCLQNKSKRKVYRHCKFTDTASWQTVVYIHGNKYKKEQKTRQSKTKQLKTKEMKQKQTMQNQKNMKN